MSKSSKNKNNNQKEVKTTKAEPPVVINDVELSSLKEKPADYFKNVESERIEILTFEKKASRRSRISLILTVALAAGSMILLPINKVVSYVLLGLIVCLLIFSMIMNKRIGRPDVQKYIRNANQLIDGFVFDHKNFSNVVVHHAEKITLEEVATNGAYNNLARLSSRNVVTGKYQEEDIKVAELALFRNTNTNKKQTCFVGKYLTMKNDLHFPGRYVLIKRKGEENKIVDSPNGIEDLVLLTQDNTFSLFGPQDANYSKDFNQKVIEKFKSIELDDLLLNLILIIQPGVSYIYASYDDKVISLPFYNPLETKAIENYKGNLLQFCEILKLISK